MTRFDRSEKENIDLEAHSFPHNSNSLVHDQEALQRCMLSNTHRKSSGLIFAPLDNQILHRSLCGSLVRCNLCDEGKHRHTEQSGQISLLGPRDPYHLHRQTKTGVTVRNERKKCRTILTNSMLSL